MWIEALTPLRVVNGTAVFHLSPGHPQPLPDQVATKLLAKASGKVRAVSRPTDVRIEPAADSARPIYWEGADRKLYGPAQPEFLVEADGHFWVVVTFGGFVRWVRSDRLRGKPEENGLQQGRAANSRQEPRGLA